MGTWEYPPGDDGETVPEGEMQPLSAVEGGFLERLKPRFSEPEYDCPKCQDTAFVPVRQNPFGVWPCDQCEAGIAAFSGWWSKAFQERSVRIERKRKRKNRLIGEAEPSRWIDPREQMPERPDDGIPI